MFDYETYMRGGYLPYEDETYAFLSQIGEKLDNVFKKIIIGCLEKHLNNDYAPNFLELLDDIDELKVKRRRKRNPINEELLCEELSGDYLNPDIIQSFFIEICEESLENAKKYGNIKILDCEEYIYNVVVPLLRYFDGRATREQAESSIRGAE